MGKEQAPDMRDSRQEETAIEPEGAVIYADAGVRPVNPGTGGWGFHGYTYSSITPKKAMGPSTHSLTVEGYLPRSEKKTELTPLKYLDAFGTIPHTSNNGAEVLAAARAMECLTRYTKPEGNNFKSVLIRSDSMYMIDNATKQMYGWKANDWRKSDGQVPANVDQWKQLERHYSHLTSCGVNVQFKWVKGHNGEHGNELVDRYATIGALISGKGIQKQLTQLSEPQDYWKGDDTTHPLIAHRRMYFVTNDSTVPGEYFLGSHGKDDDLIGKRMADGSYAYLQLDEPDVFIKQLVDRQMQVSSGQDSIIMVRLDELLKPSTKRDLLIFGGDLFTPAGAKSHNSQNLTLVGSKTKENNENEPVSVRVHPPLIAMRAIESVNFLKGMFLAWKEGKLQDVWQTDITDAFFDEDKKHGKKIKADFTSTVEAIAVKGNADSTGTKTINLELAMDVDIPNRNVFKRIERLSPKVTLLVWAESDKAYRYATIIETDGGKGIWCGYYSNYHYDFSKQ